MRNLVVIFSVCFCMAIIPNKINGIKCYVCTNPSVEDCSKVNDNMIQTCQNISSTCIKLSVKFSNSTKLTTRTCGSFNPTINNTCNYQQQDGNEATYCECDTDLCNESDKMFMKSAIIVYFLLAVVIKIVIQ
ncbi:hypothetical protein PVAND_012486 [Polypedilum vanderplanki]|uniref:Protein quiver n=1 Tax=Polypedilum vanderplanki TaxID=319348 RepID=A0A9J6CNL7_POLVA|nr:hypothetical protein PVAND_012486 [Polypedilum vanderplanki]